MKIGVWNVREGLFLTSAVHVTLIRQVMGQGGGGAACCLSCVLYWALQAQPGVDTARLVLNWRILVQKNENYSTTYISVRLLNNFMI